MNILNPEALKKKKPTGQVAGATINPYVQDALYGKYGATAQNIARKNTGYNMDAPGSLDTPGGPDYSSSIPLGSDGQKVQTLQDVMSGRSSARTTPASMSTSSTNRTPSLGGKTPNSAGSYYGSAGQNTMGTSFDVAGNSILGTLGGKNIIGGSRVDRTPGIPQDPMSAYLQQMQGLSQENIRRQMAKERQGQIDAIELSAKQAVSAEQDAGAQDLARQRSMNLRSGLGGSDFGASNKAEIRTRTKENIAGIEANRDIAYGNAINKIEELATARFNSQQTAMQNNFTNMMDLQEYGDKQTEKLKTEALESLKTLAQADPTLDMAKIQQVDPDLYESIKKGMGKTDFELDALFKQNSGRTSEYAWRGDNLVVISKDAQGNPLGTKTYKAEELGIPKDVDFQTLTNESTGEVYWYNPNDTSADGTPKLSKIGKFANTLQDENLAKMTDGMSDKDRTIFNSIVDKYAKSPLIAASDRTVVLKSVIDQIKANPNDGALQLNLAYSYIQALDTYQSAVREGELSLVNSIDSRVGKLQGEIEKITNGQIVRGDVAVQLANAADAIVQTINEGAKNAEERYRSQARVNGIETAWDEFIGGYDQQYNQAGEDAQIQEYIQKYPNASPEEILQLMEESGFSSVGGDTNQASNRPQRNNNPFNIKSSEYTKNYSGVVGTDPMPATDGGKFLVFNSPQDGLKAGERLLKTEGYKGLTVDQAMRRWSNNGYGGEIASQLQGKKVDQLTAQEMQILLKAMANREGYYA